MTKRTHWPLVCGAVAVAVVTTLASFAAEDASPNEQRVRDYVGAFNAREIDGLLALVSDDVQWLTVKGEKITVEAEGKAKLRERLAAYFKSRPGARSELVWVQVTASRVVAMEKASWQGESGPRSQSCLSVYEFKAGLISRVYDYPSEK